MSMQTNYMKDIMQTFLPEYNFVDCATVLDGKRLLKQLLEGRQIMAALSGNSKGWTNHPATNMWRDHGGMLYIYLSHIRDEMESRGYKWENNWHEIEIMYHTYFKDEKSFPSWMTSYEYEFVINTHRANLYIKAPEIYSHYMLESMDYRKYVCCDRCNYYWPVTGHAYPAKVLP